MLQVNPLHRPDTVQLMSFKSFQRLNNELFPHLPLFSETAIESGGLESQSRLLKTIYVPQNIMNVSDRLPKSTYEDIALVNRHSSMRKHNYLYSKSTKINVDRNPEDEVKLP
jgi:hypothetical protein